MTTEVTTEAQQTTVTLSPADLEAMIRRVVREELTRLVTPPAPPEPAPNGEEEAVLVERDGLLLINAKWDGDIVELIRQERERRIDHILYGTAP